MRKAILLCSAAALFHALPACDSGGSESDESGSEAGECAESGGEEEGGSEGDEPDVGPSSGSTCPTGSTLTYESFGRPFMESYCIRCHSSTLVTCEERNGAPEGHDFDALDTILLVADHVDQLAAAGPDAVNTVMPPSGGAVPTEEERRQLGEWLACEVAAAGG